MSYAADPSSSRAFRSLVLLACFAAAPGCNQSSQGPPDGRGVLDIDGGSPDGGPAGDPDGPSGDPDGPAGDPDGPAGPSEVVTPCPIARVGGLDSLAGGTIGVGPDTFLIATGEAQMNLHLVARRGASLVTLAHTRLPAFVIDTSDVVAQALGDGLLAVGELGERELSLVSVTPATDVEPVALRPRGTVMLDGQLAGLSGQGSRVWICTSDFFSGSVVSLFDVSDPDAAVAVGSLPMPSSCGSLAVNDDGKRVYVSTRDGVRFIDAAPLDTGGEPMLSEVISPAADVSTSPGYLVLRAGSTVRVLAQGDHTEVASVTASGARAASLAGGRLLVEGFRTVSGGSEGYVTLWDVLGATPPAELDEVILMTTHLTGDPPPPFHSAVTLDGSAVIARFGARLFDLSGGRLDEIRVPELTPLDQLSAAGSGSGVRAFASAGSALVDVSDPSAPIFAGGGSFGVAASFDLALDETTPTPHLVFGAHLDDPAQVTVSRTTYPDPLPINHWRLDANGRPEITGSFHVPNPGPAQLLVAGDGLYLLRLPVIPSFDVQLQFFPLASLGTAGELAQPSLDIGLSPSPPIERDPMSGFGNFAAFDVDPRARLAVVSTGTFHLGGGGDTALFWIDLAATPPRVIEEVRLAELPRHLRIAGTRAVGIGGLSILFFELGRGQVSRVSSGEAFLSHILSFDGRLVYYAQSLPFGLGVAGFGTSGVSPAPLLLDDYPQSLVATDPRLVVGLPGELATVQVRCQ